MGISVPRGVPRFPYNGKRYHYHKRQCDAEDDLPGTGAERAKGDAEKLLDDLRDAYHCQRRFKADRRRKAKV